MSDRTKTDTPSDLHHIFGDNVFNAPSQQQKREAPRRERPQQSPPRGRRAAPPPRVDQADAPDLPAMNLDNVPADRVDDEQAAANARQAHGADDRAIGNDGQPQPPREVNNQELATINRDIAAEQNVEPQWYTIAQLPGYLRDGIRSTGRTLFQTFTRTNMEDINVLANLHGGGPNEQRELNAVAGWARQNARANQRQADAMTAHFGDVIPGYEPEIQMYTTPELTFLVVQDPAGHYVYSWPTQDTVGNGGDRAQVAQDRPQLESKKPTFIEFLINS